MNTPPPATEASAATVAPYPMDTAPKDGTIVRLLVRFTDGAFDDVEPGVATWTIGQNGADHHPEDDEWLFAGWNWEQDCFTQGEGEPIGWLPFHGGLSGEPQCGVSCNGRAAEVASDMCEAVADIARNGGYINSDEVLGWASALQAGAATPAAPVGGFVVVPPGGDSFSGWAAWLRDHARSFDPYIQQPYAELLAIWLDDMGLKFPGPAMFPAAQPSAKDGVRG